MSDKFLEDIKHIQATGKVDPNIKHTKITTDKSKCIDCATEPEYILNKPQVREDGIYTPLATYIQKGTTSRYQNLIPKEVFIEAFEKFCKHRDLPDEEEYIKLYRPQMDLELNIKSEPRYRCPKCSGIMRKCCDFVLTTYPPQYRYECDDCDYSTTFTF